MDKTSLRKQIREQKRAMTPRQIETASQKLCQLFLTSELYRQAKTIYGYLPYNQEVRTIPILQRAIDDGKRVVEYKTAFVDKIKYVEYTCSYDGECFECDAEWMDYED